MAEGNDVWCLSKYALTHFIAGMQFFVATLLPDITATSG
jgi:hypothetical protein